VTEPIRLLLVDDHEMVRTGLRTFLGLQADMEVVGEAATAEQALALVPGVRPHIVLLDLVLPGMSGVDAVRRLRASHPEVKVVVLTSFAGQDDVLPAVRAGVSGYLLKDVGPVELADALRTVHAGGPVQPPHRPRAGAVGEDRQGARVGDPGQARRRGPDTGCPARRTARPRRRSTVIRPDLGRVSWTFGGACDVQTPTGYVVALAVTTR